MNPLSLLCSKTSCLMTGVLGPRKLRVISHLQNALGCKSGNSANVFSLRPALLNIITL